MGEACAQMNTTMNSEKRWYAVYTRARWEKKVAETLTKRKIENYCPLNKVMRQWADRKKMVAEPLFNSYVFVHATEEQHLQIKQTDGIVNFVYWLGHPAVIKDDEIEAVRQFLGEYSDVRLEKIVVDVNDRVRITQGPLTHKEGNVIEVKSKTVRVFLPSLGYVITAEVEKSNLEIINYASTASQSFQHAKVS